MRIFAVTLLLAEAATSYALRAQEAGDPRMGLHYARQVCAYCHAVEKGDKFSPNHLAPSFQDIANTPGITGISLAVILQSVHENMPNFVLTPNERDNIIAYILSLKHER